MLIITPPMRSSNKAHSYRQWYKFTFLCSSLYTIVLHTQTRELTQHKFIRQNCMETTFLLRSLCIFEADDSTVQNSL
jgi:hypothetical protein